MSSLPSRTGSASQAASQLARSAAAAGSDEHYLKQELFSLAERDSSIFEFLQAGCLDGIWYWDLEDPDQEWLSERFWTTLGYEPSEKRHLASEWQDLIDPRDLKLAERNLEAHCADPAVPYDQIVRYLHRDGHRVWIRSRGIAIRDEEGRPIRMLGAHTELTKQMRAEEELQRLTERFRLAVDSAGIGVWDLDLNSGELLWDERMRALYGLPPEQSTLGYTDWSARIHPDDQERAEAEVEQSLRGGQGYDTEYRVILPAGEVRHIRAFGKVDRNGDGEATRMIGVNWDITREKQLEDELRVLATTDALTGAANRHRFQLVAEDEFARAQRYGLDMSILILDVDHFKEVNDTHGHDAGDQVLRALCNTFQTGLRSSDVLCRVGGEEFSAVLTHTSLGDARQVAERTRAALEEMVVETASGWIAITVSIGVSTRRADDRLFEDLFKRADRALYTAKHEGRNRVVAIA